MKVQYNPKTKKHEVIDVRTGKVMAALQTQEIAFMWAMRLEAKQSAANT